MNISEHAKLRYAERVLKVQNPEQYIKKHELKVLKGILNMLNRSKLIYENFDWKDPTATPNDIYLSGKFLILMSPDSKGVVTMWSVYKNCTDFSELHDVNNIVNSISNSLEEMREMKNKKLKQDSRSRKLEFSIESLKEVADTNDVLNHIESKENELTKSLKIAAKIQNELRKKKQQSRNLMHELMYRTADEESESVAL